MDSELGNFMYVNTRVINDPQLYPSCELVPNGVSGVTCTDYSNAVMISNGTSMLFSPEHTFNAGIDYTYFLKNGMILRPRINYSYIGDQWINLNYDPGLDLLKGHELWSATLTLDAFNWQVEAYCNNLLDEEYVAGQFITTESYGRPREAGVRISYRF